MNIALTNFRCWEDKKFAFPEKGICLLSGRSGRGKSTILNSIVYAITGKGKNVTSFQKRSTCVSIEMDGVTITRQRGPNRLVVKKGDRQYEDDEAQSMIDSIFGSEFCNTSYIDQENTNSFVFLSPSEKIEFLEKLLLARYNIDNMKDRVKESLSSTKSDHISTDSKITTLNDMLGKMKMVEQEEVLIDTIKLTSQNRAKLYEKIKSNLDITEKNNKSVQTKIKKWEQEKIASASSNEKIHSLKCKLSDAAEEMSCLSDKETLSDQLNIFEKRKVAYLQHKSYVRFRELEKTYTERTEHNKKEKELLLAQLNDLPGREILQKSILQLESIQRIIESLLVIEDRISNPPDADKLAELVSEREILRTRLSGYQKTVADYQRYYTCPSCQKSLQFHQEKLIMGNKVDNIDELKCSVKELSKKIETIDSEIDRLKAEIVVFEKNEKEYNQMFDRLDDLLKLPTGETIEQEMVDSVHTDMIDKRKRYEMVTQSVREIDSDRLVIQLKKEMDSLKSDVNTTGSDIPGIPSEQEYPGLLEKIASTKEMVDRVSQFQRKREVYQKSLDELSPPERTDAELDELLSQNREKMETYQNKAEQYKVYLQKIEKWEITERDNTMYQSIQTQITEAECKKVSLMDRMRCLVKLRDHIKHAEQQSLMDFIDTLNRHAAIYIDDFFPDDDITVELHTVQEGKTTGKEKVTLHFVVNFRNMVGDLSFLSGGQRDRVNLAFTLAFSELVENRVLLLDECISSLDSETSNVVLDQLKTKYKGKLVIVVSHQANLGFFDHILEV
jgi:DNA repair exonuclease SbcCD ATPase subunit